MVFPSLWSTCIVLVKEQKFFSSFVAVFWWFLPSNAPIMLYNICYWWFFLSQGNRWTKYLAHPKIRRPKPCLLMFASLVALDGFHLLLSHSADCWFDSWVKWWIHVSSIVTYLCKNPLLLHWNSCKQCSESLTRCCLWSTVSKCGTHFQHTFSLTNVYAKWWIHCHLIASTPLISHTTSIYNWPKQVCRVFWYFPGQLLNLGNLSIQHHLCLYDDV